MSAQILHIISANKNQRARPICYPIALRFGTRQIHIEAGKQKIVWSGWYKQPGTKIVIAIHNRLAYIFFNLCIEKNVLFFSLSELKKAKVVPLPKSTDETNPTNYRPISLLPVLSKLLENHMHIYLNDYLEKRQLLHPFHSGFRRIYSCNTALACLTNSWLTAMNNSEVSGVVFLDLLKAFNLVDHLS